jgi:serine/threonine-protein phosphatase PP1 catalytic subunit
MHRAVIQRLLSLKRARADIVNVLQKSLIRCLCDAVRPVILSQPTFLELRSPITICGDIHGQYNDLLGIFELCEYPPATTYLFLGDYVDRGPQGIECVYLLIAYNVLYPYSFFLWHGNHECRSMNRDFGFYAECVAHDHADVWEAFSSVFYCPWRGSSM